MRDLFLGIDTSNYCTSLALVDAEGKLLAERRKLLPVKQGERGLRQSEALFLHLGQLQELAGEVLGQADPARVAAIGVSVRPRPREDSYMPVFKAGETLARALAAFCGAAVVEVSHQEGHLAAGLASAGGPEASAFLAIHLSGGTTDLLEVRRVEEQGSFYRIKQLGGSKDLHAGQLVDRIGVALGLTFPAGPALEQLARTWSGPIKPLSIPCQQGWLHLSGAETQAYKAIAAGEPAAAVARAVESCLAKGLEKLILYGREQTGLKDVLLVGGVAANQFLRQKLRKRLEHPALGIRLFFAEARYSGDNALGPALLARYNLLKKLPLTAGISPIGENK
ncbi:MULTISPECIES: hypothetical protein [Carboxydocella]|uniref:N(6)-L-threonylcarbamoyladenine synthase n=2 Tax=Carboxydocella TaxID=178898 RepID=A0A1T4NVZ7_9FIRM|nr:MULTISPECIES: hypothetical protein [Carboxydocella]AVX20149.1 N6-L-threonylcarbamoyladenine synthase [Carboxydocella thermautotrophica]AVX30568.1 N6-L-threonylcarbamoyladenine synthase [Carboxydocella thermautotrophica]SJZ83540.1 N6-L-threonylcarbamoyladenine synthase [Carboxydocella sporoproducens DSM 16521]GAW28436.1 hypothetical protein ULO1_10060 [Carboxydocella sp. ULO1]GAW30812.1 hypothetical protein JDF658_05770 [Carboxydocella sp. JDF658]